MFNAEQGETAIDPSKTDSKESSDYNGHVDPIVTLLSRMGMDSWHNEIIGDRYSDYMISWITGPSTAITGAVVGGTLLTTALAPPIGGGIIAIGLLITATIIIIERMGFRPRAEVLKARNNHDFQIKASHYLNSVSTSTNQIKEAIEKGVISPKKVFKAILEILKSEKELTDETIQTQITTMFPRAARKIFIEDGPTKVDDPMSSARFSRSVQANDSARQTTDTKAEKETTLTTEGEVKPSTGQGLSNG